jgi:succinyl-diaminopimelate desuccinylase
MYNIIENTIELMKFRSITGNIDETNKALDFCVKYFEDIKDKVFFKRGYCGKFPYLIISNKDTNEFDALFLTHIDVVPAEDTMFSPIIKENVLYGRGGMDMKAYISTSIGILRTVLIEHLPLNLGIMIVSDEEIGGETAEYLIEKKGIKTKVLLDPDAGDSINNIVQCCKSVATVKLIAIGKEAHGSMPWQGIDANEMIIQTFNNIRKSFPYYSEENKPNNEWIDTVHIGKLNGGKVDNQIAGDSEATLDFRLTERLSLDDLKNILNKSLTNDKYIKYEIINSLSTKPLNLDNQFIKKYVKLVEKETEKNVNYQKCNGFTDGQIFANKGFIVITHQATGGGFHAKDEWVDINSIYQLEKIQTEFLRNFNKI